MLMACGASMAGTAGSVICAQSKVPQPRCALPLGGPAPNTISSRPAQYLNTQPLVKILTPPISASATIDGVPARVIFRPWPAPPHLGVPDNAPVAAVRPADSACTAVSDAPMAGHSLFMLQSVPHAPLPL